MRGSPLAAEDEGRNPSVRGVLAGSGRWRYYRYAERPAGSGFRGACTVTTYTTLTHNGTGTSGSSDYGGRCRLAIGAGSSTPAYELPLNRIGASAGDELASDLRSVVPPRRVGPLNHRAGSWLGCAYLSAIGRLAPSRVLAGSPAGRSLAAEDRVQADDRRPGVAAHREQPGRPRPPSVLALGGRGPSRGGAGVLTFLSLWLELQGRCRLI